MRPPRADQAARAAPRQHLKLSGDPGLPKHTAGVSQTELLAALDARDDGERGLRVGEAIEAVDDLLVVVAEYLGMVDEHDVELPSAPRRTFEGNRRTSPEILVRTRPSPPAHAR